MPGPGFLGTSIQSLTIETGAAYAVPVRWALAAPALMRSATNLETDHNETFNQSKPPEARGKRPED